jgi:hypothetical protein
MFYLPNLLGLCCSSKWFALLYTAGILRRELRRWLHEERLLVRLFEHVLQRRRLSVGTNLFWRIVHGRRYV